MESCVKLNDNRIKILHVIQSPGGVERYIKSFLKYIDNEKFCNVLICSKDYDKDEYINLSDDFEYVDMIREISFFKDIKAVKSVRKLIKRYKPDIVFCHSSKAGAIGRIANIGIKNKCIYNPHGWAFNMKGSLKKRKMYANIERILAHMTDKIVCISKAEQRSALEWKICKKEKTKVIYNGIDFEEYEHDTSELTRQMLNIPDNAYVIGCVGRLSEQKSPDVFAKAALMIKEKIPEAFFIMVGDGDQRKDVEKIFDENNLENSFLITGWVDNPMSYIKLFDVATLLSRWEGFGLVLAEYMLAGKPIVATRVDAIPELVNEGVNGFLTDVDDANQVSEQILKIHENPELVCDIKKNAKNTVTKKFNAEIMVKEYIKLFQGMFCNK